MGIKGIDPIFTADGNVNVYDNRPARLDFFRQQMEAALNKSRKEYGETFSFVSEFIGPPYAGGQMVEKGLRYIKHGKFEDLIKFANYVYLEWESRIRRGDIPEPEPERFPGEVVPS
jgi:hypothetical protein